MATKQTTAHHTKARASAAASGKAVRDRVRELSVDAFRDRNLSMKDVPKLVHEVLDGAVQGIDNSIPKSSKNVLREVFDGLGEGVHAIASAGSAAMGQARDRGQKIAGNNVSAAAKRIRSANDEFLGAVKSFAGKTSREVRDELDDLVSRAKRTGPKVADSARKAAKAADGRLSELSGETARAGVRIARNAAGALAAGASGFFEGISEVISPRKLPTPAKKKARTTTRTTKKRPAKKAAKKSAKKKAPAKRRKA